MINLNELMRIISSDTNIRHFHIAVDVITDKVELRLSRRLTRRVLKKDGELLGYFAHFANNSFRAYSKISIPKFVIKEYADTGIIAGFNIRSRKLSDFKFMTNEINLEGIFFTQKQGFKKHLINIEKTFTVEVWSRLPINELKKRLI